MIGIDDGRLKHRPIRAPRDRPASHREIGPRTAELDARAHIQPQTKEPIWTPLGGHGRPQHDAVVPDEFRSTSCWKFSLQNGGETKPTIALRTENACLHMGRKRSDSLILKARRAPRRPTPEVVDPWNGRIGTCCKYAQRELNAHDQHVEEAEVRVQRSREEVVHHAAAQQIRSPTASGDGPLGASGCVRIRIERKNAEPTIDDEAKAEREMTDDIGAVRIKKALRIDGGTKEMEIHPTLACRKRSSLCGSLAWPHERRHWSHRHQKGKAEDPSDPAHSCRAAKRHGCPGPRDVR